MTFLDSIILGIVEGLTEFLPVSSTGHLILTAELLGISESEFVKTFEITIQLGAILAIVLLYWRKLFCDWAVMKRIAVAFVPTGIIAFSFYKHVKEWLGDPMVVVGALFLGGVVLIVFEKWHKTGSGALSDIASMPYKKAVQIGLFQAISIIPGISRSGATIVGGMLLGLSRSAIVEFSFLLAVPTMVAATGFDLLKNAHLFAHAEWSVLGVGFGVSFVVALLAVKWFLRFVEKNTFIPFGVYRIVAAVLFFWLVL